MERCVLKGGAHLGSQGSFVWTFFWSTLNDKEVHHPASRGPSGSDLTLLCQNRQRTFLSMTELLAMSSYSCGDRGAVDVEWTQHFVRAYMWVLAWSVQLLFGDVVWI